MNDMRVPPHNPDSLWPEIVPVYIPKDNWRVQLNGHDVRYESGLRTPVCASDQVALFPPGR